MNKKIPTGLLFLVLLFGGSALRSAQTDQHEIDSLKEMLGEPIPVRKEAEIAIRLAEKYLYADMEESLRYAYIAYDAAQKAGDVLLINKALMRIGNVYSIENTYSIAIEYYEEILQNTHNCHCPELAGETHMYLGQTYNYLHENKKALLHLQLADSILLQTGKMKMRHINQLFIAEALLEMGQQEKAHLLVRNSLRWFEEKNDTNGLLNTLTYLAKIDHEAGRYNEEKHTLLRMLDIIHNRDYDKFTCRIRNLLAENALQRNDLREAYLQLQKNEGCLKKHDLPKVRRKMLDLMAEYYAATREYNKAIDLLQQSRELQDSLRNQHLQEVRKLLDIRYDMESKFRSLELLKQDNNIRNLIYKKNLFYKNLSRLLLFSFGLILVVLMVIFLVRYRAHRRLVETNRRLEEVHRELTKKQKQLEQENQIRTKLFMILAHDLINPFNALLGFAELLSEEIHNFTRRDIKRHSEFIFHAAKQLHFLLENLLHWARIQTGRVHYQPAYFEINKLIRDVSEMYRYMAEKKKITLMVTNPGDLIVYADESLISVVLRNLIHNAIKYTSEKGVVTVEAEPGNDHVTVTVQDTGAGISHEDIKKIFNLEHHFSRKGTSGEEGTGLGLIICKEFLEIHGSSLHIESTPGAGSRFSFSLRKKK